MSTYQDHRDKAQRLVGEAETFISDQHPDFLAHVLAQAQVHATLALAAATHDADLHEGRVTVLYAGEV